MREDLISTEDVASILGVSRARVWQLRAHDGTFPGPVWIGRVEMAWSRSEITAWAAEHRPKTSNDPRP